MPSMPTFEIVGLDRIDLSDDTFRITTESDPADLIRSIESVGILNPPVVMPTRKKAVVVSGFRRLEACRRMGLCSVVCRVLAEDAAMRTCAMIAVADNSFCRRLNPVELSRAYRLLGEAGTPAAEISDIAGRIGLPQGPELIERLRALAGASDAVQKGVVSERIALPVALTLLRMPESTSEAFAALLASVPLSLNRQREALTLIREIALREEVDPETVARAPEIERIVADEAAGGPQKARALLSALKQRRFPSLSRAEAAFEKERRRLPLGAGMALLSPPSFEGGRYVLKLSFQSAKQLDEQLARAKDVAQHPALARLLEAD